MKTVVEIERELDCCNILNAMMTACAYTMRKAGIPVRVHRVKSIHLSTLKNTRSYCYYRTDPDGRHSYIICIDDSLLNYMQDECVLANIKNSMYHELLHTCDGCQTHNEDWMKWSALCDEKLETHTRRVIEDELYYHPTVRPGSVHRCPECGSEYWATKPLTACTCELCSSSMELILN